MARFGKYIKEILDGEIFVYPTDTIYGIGCNATIERAVKKIKDLKIREKSKPLSVIAPSFDWIEENCIVDYDLKKYLPGPYTLILKKKKEDFLHWVSSSDSLGVRIPDCEFSEYVRKAGVPFITTSVNLSGEPFAVRISEIPREIMHGVNIVVNAGEVTGTPSTLIIDDKNVAR